MKASRVVLIALLVAGIASCSLIGTKTPQKNVSEPGKAKVMSKKAMIIRPPTSHGMIVRNS